MSIHGYIATGLTDLSSPRGDDSFRWHREIQDGRCDPGSWSPGSWSRCIKIGVPCHCLQGFQKTSILSISDEKVQCYGRRASLSRNPDHGTVPERHILTTISHDKVHRAAAKLWTNCVDSNLEKRPNKCLHDRDRFDDLDSKSTIATIATRISETDHVPHR